jgi:hypothetical protein
MKNAENERQELIFQTRGAGCHGVEVELGIKAARPRMGDLAEDGQQRVSD